MLFCFSIPKDIAELHLSLKSNPRQELLFMKKVADAYTFLNIAKGEGVREQV